MNITESALVQGLQLVIQQQAEALEKAERSEWTLESDNLPEPLIDVLCWIIENGSGRFKVMCINADGEWQGYDDLRPKGEPVLAWKTLKYPLDLGRTE